MQVMVQDKSDGAAMFGLVCQLMHTHHMFK